jgi:mannosyltransferase
MHGRARLLWLMAALVVVAFTLRMINLERQPLHFDEGINVTFGSHSPLEVLTISRETFDNDPPGHRLPLITWMALAGPTPFSIRYFSVIWGVLLIPLTYRLLRALRLRAGVSMTAALIVALSAFAVDYSQEAKGYALGAAMAALSWWMWVTLATARSPRRWVRVVIYIASAALSISTHYYTVFLLPMQWVWWLGAQFRFRRIGKEALGRLAAQIAACVPLLIWVALMFTTLQVSSVRASSYREPVSAFTLLTRIFTEMSVTRYADDLTATLGALALVIAICLGAARLWFSKGEDRRNGFWFGVAIGVPIIAAIVLQQRVTFFFPRFFMYMLPNVCLLVAACILPSASRRVSNVVRMIPVALALMVLLAGNFIIHAAPLNSTTDYRGLVAMLRPYIQQGDIGLSNYIWLEGFFKSYAPETGASMSWRIDVFDASTADARMTQIMAEHPRAWFMLYKHPPEADDIAALQWLRQNTAFVGPYTHKEIAALLFDGRAPANTGATASATFGDATQLDYAVLSANVRRGETIPFTLRWTALRKWNEYATIFVHLIGEDGSLAAQSDGDAVSGMSPNFTWQPGQPVLDRRALLIRADLPPGQYELQVGMYLREGGARLHAGSLDYVPIGTLTVMP